MFTRMLVEVLKTEENAPGNKFCDSKGVIAKTAALFEIIYKSYYKYVTEKSKGHYNRYTTPDSNHNDYLNQIVIKNIFFH